MIDLILNSYFLKKEPISLVHFITNRCNARCKHCFIDFNNPEIFKQELSLKEIEKLSKNLGKNLFNVNLTGGEPFLRKDIFEIAELYFKNSGIKSVFITTNGMFTQKIKEFIDKFIKSKTNGKIIFSISIDNFEKQHDFNRNVKGLFNNAIKTYKMIQDYGNPNIISNIAITVTHHNHEEIISLYSYLKKMGIKNFTATIMREEGIVKKIPLDMKKKILDVYVKLTNKIYKDQVEGKTEGFGSHFQGRLMNSKNIIMKKIIAKTYLKKKFISNCPAGSLFGVVYANGDVYPCEILDEAKLGNLRDYDMNFMKLWNDKKTLECRRFVKNTQCNCTFECAWTLNIISNFKFIPSLMYNALKS